jgi:hypothetical protein
MKLTRNMSGFFVLAILSAGLLAAGVSSRGASMTFNITANGIKEVNSSGVPNGDPDGTAIGTLRLNYEGGTIGGFAVFNLTLANIAYPLGGHNIHMASPTTTGDIFLEFGSAESLRSGDMLTGTVQNLGNAERIASIFANPSAFYYNLNNTPFPGGAVRDQLAVPEPSTVCLGGVAAAITVVWMKRRSQKRG